VVAVCAAPLGPGAAARAADADRAGCHQPERSARSRRRAGRTRGSVIVRVKQRAESGRSQSSVARRAAIRRSVKSTGAIRPARGVPAVALPVVPAPKPSRRGAMGKYVYCIIRASDELTYGPIGLGAEPADVY